MPADFIPVVHINQTICKADVLELHWNSLLIQQFLHRSFIEDIHQRPNFFDGSACCFPESEVLLSVDGPPLDERLVTPDFRLCPQCS